MEKQYFSWFYATLKQFTLLETSYLSYPVLEPDSWPEVWLVWLMFVQGQEDST